MPHKQKKHTNAFKDGSPRAERKTFVPEPSPFAPPVLPLTNYREIHLNEVEALRSIYGDDFEEVEHRRSAWQVCIYASRAVFVVFLTASVSAIVECYI